MTIGRVKREKRRGHAGYDAVTIIRIMRRVQRAVRELTRKPRTVLLLPYVMGAIEGRIKGGATRGIDGSPCRIPVGKSD